MGLPMFLAVALMLLVAPSTLGVYANPPGVYVFPPTVPTESVPGALQLTEFLTVPDLITVAALAPPDRAAKEQLWIATLSFGPSKSIITIYDRNTAANLGVAVDLAAVAYPKFAAYPVIQIYNFAFHPDFESSRRVFMFIRALPLLDDSVPPFDATAARGYTIIAEIQTPRTATGAFAADVSTFKVVYEFQDPLPTSSGDLSTAGGLLVFGPGDCLYVGTGDVSIPLEQGNVRARNTTFAQDPSSPHGKILRLEELHPARYGWEPRMAYGAQPEGLASDWSKDMLALGLRQPYRGSFVGDKLYVGEVGEQAKEEIDILHTHKATGAVNLGWPVYEGTTCYAGPCNAASRHKYTFPQYEYSHTDDSAGACAVDARSVLGGVLYHGSDIPFLRGHYVLSDSVCPFWRSLPPYHHGFHGVAITYSVVNPAPVFYTTSIGVDGYGELYQLGTDFQYSYVHRLGVKK